MILNKRALNRALLSRQYLIERTDLSTQEVLENLAGLQSQAPNPPYYGLWTRMNGFTPDSLGRLIVDRTAVRTALMRSTIFLVAAKDALAFRPVLQPVLERGWKGNWGKKLPGVDIEAVKKLSKELVEERPLTFEELGKRLRERWPDAEPAALATVSRTFLPLVQVPPRGLWGESGKALHTTAESWLGEPLDLSYGVDSLILRYLKAYGPATVHDVQTWCGLTKLAESMERLRPQLETFRDENGQELFDLKEAGRPSADTPVPVRFLAEFDNMLLSYQDRSRILADEYRSRVFTVNGIVKATILIDGFVQGIWRIERDKSIATLIIEPFRPLAERDREALADEGARLLAFAAADADRREVRFSDPA